MTTRSAAPRRGIRIVAAGALTAGLVLAAPLAAGAHVTVTPGDAEADASSVLTFAFSHGCDDSPTTALRIEIPEGVQSVYPTLQAGWTIQTEQAENGSVSAVTYTADEPVPTGVRAAIEVAVRFGEETAHTDVAFPVTQTCVTGEVAWAEIAAEGQDEDDLEAPAPVVAVGDVAEGSGHDHADDSSDEASSDHDSSDHEDGTAEEASASSDALPIALGAGGLALGVVALVLSALALRRSRA